MAAVAAGEREGGEQSGCPMVGDKAVVATRGVAKGPGEQHLPTPQGPVIGRLSRSRVHARVASLRTRERLIKVDAEAELWWNLGGRGVISRDGSAAHPNLAGLINCSALERGVFDPRAGTTPPIENSQSRAQRLALTASSGSADRMATALNRWRSEPLSALNPDAAKGVQAQQDLCPRVPKSRVQEPMYLA